jgi:hypothetical protein
MSDDNPRGYTEQQLQRIDDAPTVRQKMKVELRVINQRLLNEKNLKEPLNDGYGLERIAAMEAEIWADYAAKMADEESEDAMKNDNPVGDMEMIERLRQENR